MPGSVRPVIDERDGLLAYLEQQRYALRLAVRGLSEEHARARPSASALSLGGLIKHVALTERNWMVGMVAGRPLPKLDWNSVFHLQEGETLGGWLETYAQVAAESDAIARARSLDELVPVPRGVPWFPQDVEAWSLRWVLLHLIEETARHAGHADIIRESLDRATALGLMAEAEGWSDQLAVWMKSAT